MSAQKPFKLLVCLALLFEGPPGWPQENHSTDLANRVSQGSTEAMLEAGNKGATGLIPLLRNHLKDPNEANYSGRPGNWQPRQAAQLALAKLGDRIEQQEIGCELFYGNPAEQSTAFYKLEYVGGWFEITRLTRFLPATEENSKYMPEPGIPNGDATIGTRQYLAVGALDRMSLGQPAALLSKEHPLVTAPRRASELQQYIDAHWKELAKLLPTGEGAVESDEYCEPYIASMPDRPDSYRVFAIEGEIRVIMVEQSGFGTRQGNAIFNGRNVPIRQWTNNGVMVELPTHVTGDLTIVKADSKTVTISLINRDKPAPSPHEMIK